MARKGLFGRNKPNHPQRLEVRERNAEWVKMRLAGMGINQIAAQSGVVKSTVSQAISAYMAELGREDAEALRVIENARLDYMQSKQWPRLEADETIDAAVDRLLRISKRRSEINGSDRPAQAPVGPDGKPIMPTVNVHYHEKEPTA